MSESAFQSTFLSAMHGRLRTSIEQSQSITSGLNRDQLNWKPAPDKWSIGQCYEHIALGAEEYDGKMTPAWHKATTKGLSITEDVAPKHSFIGKAILREVDPAAGRTMKAPKIFTPGASNVDEGITDRFVNSHERILTLIQECDGLDFNRLRLSSPVAPIFRINAADAIKILVTHAERHLTQAKYVREMPDFSV